MATKQIYGNILGSTGAPVFYFLVENFLKKGERFYNILHFLRNLSQNVSAKLVGRFVQMTGEGGNRSTPPCNVSPCQGSCLQMDSKVFESHTKSLEINLLVI